MVALLAAIGGSLVATGASTGSLALWLPGAVLTACAFALER